MSSDGSVSSRISQFGLYRTIDARTEEFLKLSKKRQIRQGCVCAAISTALTVTVVVTVLLIYEYNVISKARRSSYKTNWLGLMNNSANDSNLLEILNKEKIDIDKTTLKLLPILIKALNQNNYVDKIIEEPTSRYAPYEKDITTETTITKNIFADTRNWMKTPSSRLYAIEYKTSPIVYFKNPTRNIEYFTKIRKIRDYQRILNYVDKMISEKNYLGTTQPMRRDYDHTEEPYKITTQSLNYKPKLKMLKKQKTPLNTTLEEKRNCKCFHKLSRVMYKLLNSIQQLLSFFSGLNSKELFGCKNNTPIQTKPLKTLIETSTAKSVHTIITENYNNFETKLTRDPSYKTFLNRHKYTIDSPIKGIDIRRDHTVNAIMNLIKPNFKKYTEVDINFESNEAFSTTNSYLKSSNNNILSKNIDITNTKSSTDTVTTVADYILQKGSYDVSSEMQSPLSTFPESDFSDDDDDYADTTETSTMLNNNNIKRFDTHAQDLKNNIIVGKQIHISMKDKSYPFKGARASQKLYNRIGTMRKMGNLVSKDKEESLILPYKYRFAPISNQSTKPTRNPTNLRLNNKINITSTTESTRQTIATIIKNTTEMKGIKFTDYKKNLTNYSPSNETDKLLEENISKESSLKHIEEAIMILNNETTIKENENDTKILENTYQWEMVKSEENTSVTKSMLPQGRSTYLEMQRNDWKHEEIHDFDNDMNYIFD